MGIGTIPFIILLLGTLIYFSMISFGSLLHFTLGILWTLAVSSFIMVNRFIELSWMDSVITRIRNFRSKKKDEEENW